MRLVGLGNIKSILGVMMSGMMVRMIRVLKIMVMVNMLKLQPRLYIIDSSLMVVFVQARVQHSSGATVFHGSRTRMQHCTRAAVQHRV